ncbi:MAG: GntR family transcriptional regulator [Proteobacteria bacterium]|nr:MAG: GntR family transcriptional regulator [Pseudomonadota bacterium]
MTVGEQLFHKISQDIIEGILKPLQKLSEPELAKKYGTSRAPLREAISRLAERGMIVIKPRQGPSVAEFSMEKFIEIFEIREALESHACRLAAERMTNNELAQIRRIVLCHEKLIKASNKEEYTHQYKDIDFHFLIAKGSGNTFLQKLLCEDYYDLLLVHRNYHKWVKSRGSQALKDHFNILMALEERDGELAEMLMRRHIKYARISIKKTYQEFIQNGGNKRAHLSNKSKRHLQT